MISWSIMDNTEKGLNANMSIETLELIDFRDEFQVKIRVRYQVADGSQCCCNILNSGPGSWALVIIVIGFMSSNNLCLFGLIKLLVLLLEFLRMENSQCGGITIYNQLLVVKKKTED